MTRLYLVAFLGAVALTACSSGTTPLAVIGSADGSIGVGQERVLLALIDPETNEFLAAEDVAAQATLRDEDGTPLGTYDLEFRWTIPDVRGIYVGHFDIPEAGLYQLSIKAGQYRETGPVGFQAVSDPSVVQVGDPAPRSETRTSAEFPDLSIITSDPDPDPHLYAMTVAAAVTSGSPSVIVFATPAFCVSQACGPMVDQVKELRADYPGFDFVHVEIYQDLQVQSLSDLTVVDAVVEWGLPSEPWVFVVDEEGVVAAAFEGVVGDEELAAVLDGLSP